MGCAWLELCAARAAATRYWGVPYEDELTPRERRGMRRLEVRGEARRDEGFTGRHWHLIERHAR